MTNACEITENPSAGAACPCLGRICLAEALGTFLLVLFGCGVVHAAVLMDAQTGPWQIAAVWGVVIMLVIYMLGGISGAHINPAVTIAFAATGRLRWTLAGPYIASQLVGAFLAAAVLFTLFQPYLAAKEEAKGVVRGQAGSEITAMCYGEYFPSPGPMAAGEENFSHEEHQRRSELVPHHAAFLVEVLGTALLLLVICAVTDEGNCGAPPSWPAPVFIGLTVSALISFIAPLTQGCFNPARDFGPRLFAYLAGWGPIAIPGPRGLGFLTVYIVAPTLGGLLGAGGYDFFLRRR